LWVPDPSMPSFLPRRDTPSVTATSGVSPDGHGRYYEPRMHQPPQPQHWEESAGLMYYTPGYYYPGDGMMMASPSPYYYGEDVATGGHAGSIEPLNATAPAFNPSYGSREGSSGTTLGLEGQSQGYYYGVQSSTAASGASAAYFYPGIVS